MFAFSECASVNNISNPRGHTKERWSHQVGYCSQTTYITNVQSVRVTGVEQALFKETGYSVRNHTIALMIRVLGCG